MHLPVDLLEELDVLDDRLVGGEQDVELDDGVLLEVVHVRRGDVRLAEVELVVPNYLSRLPVGRRSVVVGAGQSVLAMDGSTTHGNGHD